MIEYLAAYIRANGLACEVIPDALIISIEDRSITWPLPYSEMYFVMHRDILLNEADEKIKKIRESREGR